MLMLCPLFTFNSGGTMMGSDNTMVIISVCGIAAVVGVFVILAGFLVVRIFKTSLFSMAMMAMKIFAEPKDESTVESVRAQTVSRTKRDLHAQAKSLDFDSAVARQAATRGTPTTPTSGNTPSAQAVPPPGFETPSTSQYPSLNKRRRRKPEGEDEELDLLEAFGDED
jgi:hypothetical protein